MAINLITIINLVIDISIFGIVTLSLNLEVGFTGIPQFGRVIAVIVGAFTAGSIPGRVMAFLWGIPDAELYADGPHNVVIVANINSILASNPLIAIIYMLSSLILAAIVGAIVGWLTSRPAVRLKEAYLGISLLAFGDILMFIGINYNPIVGGTIPVMVPDPFAWVWGPMRSIAYAVVTALLMGFVLFLLYRLTKSPFGRSLKMLRDNELTSNVYGKDTVKVRTTSLVIGSMIASIAGAIYVMFIGAANSQAFSRLNWTFYPWAYLMLGGVANNFGILIGVTFFIIARTAIIISKPFLVAIGVPFEPIWLEYTLAGAVMIVVVLFKPRGLIPEKPETSMSTERIHEIVARLNGQDVGPAEDQAAPSQTTDASEGTVTDNQNKEGTSNPRTPPDSVG
ncbi:MAG: branched-chain amino acid ABC transporter permease [Candidatus Thorarchaeota archaeon]